MFQDSISQRSSQFGDDANFEQLMVSMLDERDKLVDSLKNEQEKTGDLESKVKELEKERDSLQRQLNQSLPQVRNLHFRHQILFPLPPSLAPSVPPQKSLHPPPPPHPPRSVSPSPYAPLQNPRGLFLEFIVTAVWQFSNLFCRWCLLGGERVLVLAGYFDVRQHWIKVGWSFYKKFIIQDTQSCLQVIPNIPVIALLR